ncbi:conserved hypothetical protein [Aspergillus terreus NIH2624]|uniref:Regulator of phospholipase D SRF1 n=1 Tax=Aspergillus terreus (strain NIH 2624 / FGSC A1156) TaxID=341663 RepID=Q0D0P1_ASPTN|nr:uncharacterized protein ATEG_00493 [Aspergillus terreus NIH2624]EAU39139.1 conserved hypothetical protein [Aspergillus terreus NIH2624]
MAQDVRNSRLPPPELGPVLDERLIETPYAADGASYHSHNGQNSESRSWEPLRNGTLEPSSSNTRTPDGSVSHEDNETYHGLTGKRLRTLPAWIKSVEYPEDEAESSVTSRLLPSQPDEAVVAQHNHSPYATSRPKPESLSREGLDGDHEAAAGRESRWKNFSKSIAYPREPGAEEKLVTPEWLNENHGDYSQPWRGQLEEWEQEDTEDPMRMKKRRQIWFKRFHNTLLKSPMVPLIFRLTGPSALMAIIVDAVALVYLVYITWDEYTSKPLGLRSPSAKARLVLLDIFFIVFDSANLSLAFESLSTVSGACTVGEINQEIAPKNDAICDRQKALACVLLIALLAWLTTFSISVLRLVERVAQ